jgi:hypothetical protein
MDSYMHRPKTIYTYEIQTDTVQVKYIHRYKFHGHTYIYARIHTCAGLWTEAINNVLGADFKGKKEDEGDGKSDGDKPEGDGGDGKPGPADKKDRGTILAGGEPSPGRCVCVCLYV